LSEKNGAAYFERMGSPTSFHLFSLTENLNLESKE
jgi:hypothetical protein